MSNVSEFPYAQSLEVQHMCVVKKGCDHGPAPLPEEGKWIQAKQISDRMIEDAKAKANEEKDRIIESAKELIEHEKMAAATEVKNQIADISIKVAEKIIGKVLESDKEQLDYINRLLQEIDDRNQKH